jgi:hypothetical protein
MATSSKPSEEFPEVYGILEGTDDSALLDKESIKQLDDEALFIMTLTGNEAAIREHGRRFDENRAQQKASGNEVAQ